MTGPRIDPATSPAQGLDERVGRAVEAVRERMARAAVRVGRDPREVTLVAVTKAHPVEMVRAALRAGIDDFGENHAADLAAKAVAVPARWHFLGKLQSGTVRHVADHADVVHSGEPGSALARLARRRATSGSPMDVLIEVDFTGLRQGVAPADTDSFADALATMDGVRLAGLMTVAPPTPDAEGARPYFARLRRLSEHVRVGHPEARDLSMGMTVDYEIGVEEGATMVRVGTALFGTRSMGR